MNNFHTNKTQYDWFPGKSQNSKKFYTKNQEDSQLHLKFQVKKLSKQSILAKKWSNFRLTAKILQNQNFPGIQSMIFSKTTIRITSIPIIRKIHSGVWKLQVKNSKTVNLALNGQNFAIPWPKIRHIRIFATYRV